VTEKHGHELSPTGEASGMALGPVLNDGPLEPGAGNHCNI
jgi:hypothetical protein